VKILSRRELVLATMLTRVKQPGSQPGIQSCSFKHYMVRGGRGYPPRKYTVDFPGEEIATRCFPPRRDSASATPFLGKHLRLPFFRRNLREKNSIASRMAFLSLFFSDCFLRCSGTRAEIYAIGLFLFQRLGTLAGASAHGRSVRCMPGFDDPSAEEVPLQST